PGIALGLRGAGPAHPVAGADLAGPGPGHLAPTGTGPPRLSRAPAVGRPAGVALGRRVGPARPSDQPWRPAVPTPRSAVLAAAPDGAELLRHPQRLGQRALGETGRELVWVAAQPAHETARLAGDALAQVGEVVLRDVQPGHRAAAGAADLGHEAPGIDHLVLRVLLARSAPQEALLDAHRPLLTKTSNLAR